MSTAAIEGPDRRLWADAPMQAVGPVRVHWHCGVPPALSDIRRFADVFVPERYSGRECSAWRVDIVEACPDFIEEYYGHTVLGFAARYGTPHRELALVIAHYCSIVREEQGLFTMHAGAVVGTNGAVIVAGPMKSGKTTVVSELRDRHGLPAIATNQALLCVRSARACIAGGTTLWTSRALQLSKRIRDGVWLTTRGQTGNAPNGSLASLPRKEIPIRAVCFLSPGRGRTELTTMPDPDVRLFCALSERPRLSVLFQRSGLISWPFEDRPLAEARAAFAKRLAEVIPVVEVGGGSREVANVIASELT